MPTFLAKPPSPRVRCGHPLAAGLVGEWALADGAGPIARELVRRADGTLAGGATWARSPWGAALDFDGAAGIVDAASPASGLTAATFQVIVYQKETGSLYGGWFGSNNAYNAGFFLGRDVGAAAQAYVGPLKLSSGSLGEAAWHNLILTFRGGSRLALYVDGVPVASATASVPTSVPAHTGVQLGNNTASGLPAACTIAVARIWSRALSDTDVEQLQADPFAMVRPRRAFAPLPVVAPAPAAPVVARARPWFPGLRRRTVAR